MDSSSHWLITEISHKGIATLTLNRADKHNAFDDHLIQLLIVELQSLAKPESLRGLVLTGKGKSFPQEQI